MGRSPSSLCEYKFSIMTSGYRQPSINGASNAPKASLHAALTSFFVVPGAAVLLSLIQSHYLEQLLVIKSSRYKTKAIWLAVGIQV